MDPYVKMYPYVKIPVRVGDYPGNSMDLNGNSYVKISTRSYHDLSQIISEEMPVYPGEPHPEFKPHFSIGKDKVNVSSLSLSSHTGTHVDAPKHFFPDGQSIEKIQGETFMGRSTILDISYKGAGQGITANDLDDYAGDVQVGDIILLYTGSSESLQLDDNARRNFSYLEESAADWILNHKVKCVGIDSLSVEKYGFVEGVVHKKLLAANVGIIEGLSQQLKNFVGKRMFLVCLPLLLKEIDGSPARAVLFDLL